MRPSCFTCQRAAITGVACGAHSGRFGGSEKIAKPTLQRHPAIDWHAQGRGQIRLHNPSSIKFTRLFDPAG